MYQSQKAVCGAYQKNDLANLTPGQIIARLYQALELSLKRARGALVDRDVSRQGEQMSRALAIIGELQSSLNLEAGGEIGENLNNLYFYLIEEISKANLSKDVKHLDNSIATVKPLTEAWVELAEGKANENSVRTGGRPVEARPRVAFQATF
ncbi:MAG: flagellar export chaperone FliS [Desulfobulbaceae bacterium]|uniref:Flagellar export chaperone FliS n=1 Tax=Candidatus Desulfobia pelagia TaxID=2841692 RepID=A0A8J6NCT1_9BACT|nr:flagellar export chaperone FliS [Candidatus Desulfobia pelagia]